jgi:hypothetical protein
MPELSKSTETSHASQHGRFCARDGRTPAKPSIAPVSSQETARLADGGATSTCLRLRGEESATARLIGAAAAHAEEREHGGPEEHSELHRLYSGKAIR